MARDVFGIVGTTQAGSFKIERVVAEGGFGVVYRAQHASFRAPVALKLLKVPESMSDAARDEFFERFRSEGELLFRLSQAIPQIVRPLHVDVLELGDRRVPFLALEWLEGETLDRVIAKRSAAGSAPMGLYRSVKLLAPIAAALARAHRFPGPNGFECVSHRDLKPENIFVARIGGEEVPKILDFGIARVKSLSSSQAGRVTDGERVTSFTPGYAAPEQWLPKRYGQPGPWTDVFGLAMTLLEMVTGRPPLEGDLQAMMATTCDLDRRPTPRTEGVEISDEAEAAFALALAVDPRARAKSIERFWTPLEKALGMPPTLLPDPEDDGPISLEIASDEDERESSGGATVRGGGRRGFGVLPTLDLPLPDALPGGRDAAKRLQPPVPTLPASGVSARHAQVPDLDAPGPRRGPSSRPASAASLLAPDDANGRFDVHELDAPRPVPRARDAPPPPLEPYLRYERFAQAEPSAYARLRPALKYIYLAIAIAVGDAGYAAWTHETLSFASFRPVWLAGPLLAIGIAIAAWRIFAAQE